MLVVELFGSFVPGNCVCGFVGSWQVSPLWFFVELVAEEGSFVEYLTVAHVKEVLLMIVISVLVTLEVFSGIQERKKESILSLSKIISFRSEKPKKKTCILVRYMYKY